MIHGMWGGPWCWTNYRSVFESVGWRCTAITLPYHDLAPGAAPDLRLGTIGLLDFCEAIEREIRLLNERPILVGHSMGALLAQMLAARGLGKALVLLTPAAPAGIMALTPSVLRRFWRIQTTWGFWKKPIRPTFDQAAGAILHRLPKMEQKRAYEQFVYESGRAIFEIAYWPLDSRAAARVDASKVTCPVLVVAGAHDRITPAAVVRKVARRYGAVATYREFDDHAHWVLGEPGWEEIAELARSWIASVGSS